MLHLRGLTLTELSELSIGQLFFLPIDDYTIDREIVLTSTITYFIIPESPKLDITLIPEPKYYVLEAQPRGYSLPMKVDHWTLPNFGDE